jgi:hypothetical protein
MQTELFIKMSLTAWKAQNKRLDDMIAKYSNNQWNSDTAPGRNSGIYLLGHLTAVNDAMRPLLGFGEKLYPELEALFITSADKAGHNFPSLDDLKKYWKEINAKLDTDMAAMNTDDWFAKHTVVSAEDFAKEPHRNKLNILLSRTVHQSYHLGQLAYLG